MSATITLRSPAPNMQWKPLQDAVNQAKPKHPALIIKHHLRFHYVYNGSRMQEIFRLQQNMIDEDGMRIPIDAPSCPYERPIFTGDCSSQDLVTCWCMMWCPVLILCCIPQYLCVDPHTRKRLTKNFVQLIRAGDQWTDNKLGQLGSTAQVAQQIATAQGVSGGSMILTAPGAEPVVIPMDSEGRPQFLSLMREDQPTDDSFQPANAGAFTTHTQSNEQTPLLGDGS